VADLTRGIFDKAWIDSAPGKLEDLKPDQLQAFYHYFSEAHAQTGDAQQMRQAAGRRDELRNEIEKRRTDAQHKEAMKLGDKTLTVSRDTLS
jgi:hypothetical protein